MNSKEIIEKAEKYIYDESLISFLYFYYLFNICHFI